MKDTDTLRGIHIMADLSCCDCCKFENLETRLRFILHGISVFRIRIHWTRIRLQPKISIQIQAITLQYLKIL